MGIHMDPLTAAHKVAHDFRDGGAVALARLMTKNPGTFLNELNPDQEGHKLGLATAVLMTELADDNRVIESWAQQRGLMVLPVPADHFPHDTELIALLLKRDRKAGEFARVIDEALENGEISHHEAALIRAWGHRLIASVMELVVRLESIAR